MHLRWRSILIGVLSLLGAVQKDAKAVLQEEECTEEIRQKYCMDPDNMEQCPEECE